MERLTKKSDISDVVWFVDREHESGYAEREPCDMDSHHARLAITKLAQYEDLEEKNRLLKLPCAIGSTLYKIKHRYTKCSKHQEEFGEYSCCGCEEDCDSHKEYYIDEIKPSIGWIVDNMQWIGNSTFITREEAEKKLTELK